MSAEIEPVEPGDPIARLERLASTPPTIEGVLVAWLEALTDASRRTYAADLAAFAAWAGLDERESLARLFGGGGPQANAIVLAYRADLLAWRSPDGRGLAPATVSRRLSALRSVAKIARLCGIFAGDIEIPGPKVYRVRDVRGPGPEAYRAILEQIEHEIEIGDGPARRQWERIRDAAILRLLHDCMLRRVEVQRLDRDDVQGEDLRIRPKGPRGAVVVVPASDQALAHLRRFLSVRGGHAGPLFCAWRRTSRIDLSTINRITARRAQAAGVVCRPHGLRHTAITCALDVSGGDVRAVASLARHQNPSTTLRYDDRAHEAARDLANKIGA